MKRVLKYIREEGVERTDTMIAGSHERIIPKVATDICLDHFAADSITRDKVFILAACHNVSWGRKMPSALIKVPWVRWVKLEIKSRAKVKILGL